MLFTFAVFVAICKVATGAVEDSEWVGKRFPTSNIIQGGTEDDEQYLELDHHGRIPMGIKNVECDWGEDPNGLDGDLSPESYMCFEEKSQFQPEPTRHPILIKDHVPKSYVPGHHCMNESITYHVAIPTYGDHRPLWPRYGEYNFVPKQRWVHSLEHGAIVMLYHPCADINEMKILKNIVKGCLFQYIITSLNELTTERPLVLVAWGARLEISKVDPTLVVDFIREHAYQSPEKVDDDGQYDKNLVEPASVHLKGQQNKLCPNN